MITINLLPIELREVGETSPTRILFIAASILIGLVSFGFYLFVHFHELPNKQQELKQTQTHRESLKKFEQKHKKLQGLIKSYVARDSAVESVKAMRVPLSKKLYEFADFLAKGNHPVWIKSLTVSGKLKKSGGKKRRGRRKKGPAKPASPVFLWKCPATCASSTLHPATNFYTALRSDEVFFKDFTQINVPQYTRSNLPKRYAQKYMWNFKMNMTMQMQLAKPKKVAQKKGKAKGKKKRG